MVCCFAQRKFYGIENLRCVTPIETTDSSGLFVFISREATIQTVDPSYLTWDLLMAEQVNETGCARQYIHRAAQSDLNGY